MAELTIVLNYEYTNRHEDAWRGEDIAPRILNLVIRIEWLASRLGRLNPRRKSRGTLWVGGLMLHRAVAPAANRTPVPRPANQ
jgi:hypothetical protein